MIAREAMLVHGCAAPADRLTALVAACVLRRRPLDEADADILMRALLDKSIASADRKAVLDVYAERRPTAAETRGFCRALAADAHVLGRPTARSGPVVLTSSATANGDAAAIALLALLLERFGVAVVVVEAANGSRTSAAAMLRALGVVTSPDAGHAEAQLRRSGVACMLLDVVAPRAARLLRGARGNRSLSALAKLIDPFGEGGLRAIVAHDTAERAWLQKVLGATVSAIVWPPPAEAAMTPAQIAQILAGGRPVPARTLAQLGACLEAVRRCVLVGGCDRGASRRVEPGERRAQRDDVADDDQRRGLEPRGARLRR